MTAHVYARTVSGNRQQRFGRLLGAAGIALSLALGTGPASAQGWQWPWSSQPERAPVPREPVFRGPAPQPAPPGVQPGPGGSFGQPYAQQQRGSVCQQLEQRLVQETQRGNPSRDLLPKLEGDIRQLERTVQSGSSQLERNDCFEYFLFAKSLRRSRQCIDLNNQVEAAKRQLSDLQTQRQQFVATQGRSYQDEIIRELARNNCGANYQQEAQKRSGNPLSSLWQDDEGGSQGGGGNQFGNLPFATFRTVCVRLCDGYFFPISFSTLENHFQRDADACQSKCAAPVELYYHANPGGAMEQAMSVKSKQPYTSLRTAFRYRKEFVQGCSCKQAEYVPTPQSAADRRAEAAPPLPPTGPTRR